MYTTLLIIFLLVTIALVSLIMLQQGKGADMGSSFGAGASGTLFGSTGSATFMSRLTAILATLFFIICLILGNLTSNDAIKKGEFDDLSVPVKQEQEHPITSSVNDIPN